MGLFSGKYINNTSIQTNNLYSNQNNFSKMVRKTALAKSKKGLSAAGYLVEWTKFGEAQLKGYLTSGRGTYQYKLPDAKVTKYSYKYDGYDELGNLIKVKDAKSDSIELTAYPIATIRSQFFSIDEYDYDPDKPKTYDKKKYYKPEKITEELYNQTKLLVKAAGINIEDLINSIKGVDSEGEPVENPPELDKIKDVYYLLGLEPRKTYEVDDADDILKGSWDYETKDKRVYNATSKALYNFFSKVEYECNSTTPTEVYGYQYVVDEDPYINITEWDQYPITLTEGNFGYPESYRRYVIPSDIKIYRRLAIKVTDDLNSSTDIHGYYNKVNIEVTSLANYYYGNKYLENKEYASINKLLADTYDTKEIINGMEVVVISKDQIEDIVSKNTNAVFYIGDTSDIEVRIPTGTYTLDYLISNDLVYSGPNTDQFRIHKEYLTDVFLDVIGLSKDQIGLVDSPSNDNTLEKNRLIIQKQVDDNTISTIVCKNMRNVVYSHTGIDPNDAQNTDIGKYGFVIPLNTWMTNGTSYLDKSGIFEESNYIQIIAFDRTYLPWYATGIFQAILTVIVVVIIVVEIYTGNWELLPETASALGISSVAELVFYGILISVTAQIALYAIAELIDNPGLRAALSFAVMIASMAATMGLTGFSFTPITAVQLCDTIVQTADIYIQASMEQLTKSISEFTELMTNAMRTVQEAAKEISDTLSVDDMIELNISNNNNNNNDTGLVRPWHIAPESYFEQATTNKSLEDLFYVSSHIPEVSIWQSQLLGEQTI